MAWLQAKKKVRFLPWAPEVGNRDGVRAMISAMSISWDLGEGSHHRKLP